MMTCIIGAGSGIGRALALFLARKGHSLILSFPSEASKTLFLIMSFSQRQNVIVMWGI